MSRRTPPPPPQKTLEETNYVLRCRQQKNSLNGTHYEESGSDLLLELNFRSKFSFRASFSFNSSKTTFTPVFLRPSSVPEKELPGPACEGGGLGGGSGQRGEGAIHHLLQPRGPALQARLLLQPRLELLLQPADRLAGAAAHPASLFLHLAEVHPVRTRKGRFMQGNSTRGC